MKLFFFSELKRRLKAEQKAKEKAEKEAQKAAAASANADSNATKKKSAAASEEEISPNEYFKLRSAAIVDLKKSSDTHPYPHKFNVSISLENFIKKYENLKEGEMLEDVALR